MIAMLRGRVAAIDDDRLTVDCNGVGYEVFCHLRTIAAVHQDGKGGEITLHIHTAVSDDAIRLYGFMTAAELRFYRLLLGVERIGPKAALGILGRSEMQQMVTAIKNGDAGLVATVPGVGRKTAERVILELRDKLADFTWQDTQVSAVGRAHSGVEAAVSGLVGLGFREAEARAAVEQAKSTIGADADVAVLVSAALRHLDKAGSTS